MNTLTAGKAKVGSLLVKETASFLNSLSIGGFLRLGALEEAPIENGVLTVTKSFVNPQPEASTSDQVDSIVVSGTTVAQGDLLVVHVPETNTITFDDANINLGAATRAVAPGGVLILVYNGTKWNEVLFLASADNS